jgi:hypothetical protein
MRKNNGAGKSPGITLVEIIVACLLLVVVGLVTWALLKNAINATAHGHLQVKIQENARNVMNTMAGEIRQASRPPKIGTSPQYTSGVLYPPTSLQDSGTQQRILFAEMSGLGTASGINFQTNINTYRIVEYRAFPNDATGKARIVRTVWNASSTDALYITTGVLGLSYVDPNFNFTLTPFNGTVAPLAQNTVLELPNTNDTLSLFFSHPPLAGSLTRFDDRIFNVRLTLMQTLNNNLNRKKDHSVETVVYVR